MGTDLPSGDKEDKILSFLEKSDKAFEAVIKHYSGQFNYHAAQRLTTFRYFVTAFSIFTAAYAALLTSGTGEMPLAAAGVALLAYLLVICFARLDKRNEQIILINEEPISQIQSRIDQHVNGEGKFSTFERSDNEKQFFMTFGMVLPVVFIITGVASIGAMMLAFTSDKISWQPKTVVWLAMLGVAIAAVYLPTKYKRKT